MSLERQAEATSLTALEAISSLDFVLKSNEFNARK